MTLARPVVRFVETLQLSQGKRARERFEVWPRQCPAGEPLSSDYRSIRLEANPPQILVALHRQTMIHVLTAGGIPAEFVAAGDGTARREAWWQFVFRSVALLVHSAEAKTVKLEAP